MGDVEGGSRSEPVSADAFGELEILGHNGDSLGVDGAEVGVFEERDEVGLGGFLEGEHCLALESHLLLVFGGDLTHQPLEGQFPDEQVGLSEGVRGMKTNRVGVGGEKSIRFFGIFGFRGGQRFQA